MSNSELQKYNIYPNSTPEFRTLVKIDGTNQLQVRYINLAMGYTGKWQPIQVVYEQENEVK